MIVSINQPAYLPWLGYFERIIRSDIHVVLDHVQFEKNSYTNRNKINTYHGPKWLTVPVSTSGKFGNLPINEVTICNNQNWAIKHLKTISANYSKSCFFEEYIEFFEQLYYKKHDLLSNLNNEILVFLIEKLNIKTKIVYSSELGIEGKKDTLILNICKNLGAKCYLSGILGKQYLRESMFYNEGIDICYQNYQHPRYKQIHGEFQPYLSFLDLLMNAGEDLTKEILYKSN